MKTNYKTITRIFIFDLIILSIFKFPKFYIVLLILMLFAKALFESGEATE